MPEEKESPAPAAQNKAAIEVPGYRIEAEVGRGGMGVVYRARQESLGRRVALKVLGRAAAKNEPFVERFLREARAAAKLNHENVVAAIDAGRAGDVVYFVMEFVDGETARERLDREGPLPVRDVLRILRDTAAALEHARRHGLVHRDVKPDNIMLSREGRAKLCDLGLARLAGGEAGAKTGIAEGTPYYIAPEQARGLADVDIRADLYALGATAYHLLAGHYPFDGDGAREIMAKHVNCPFPDVTEERKDLPASLVALIERLVEKDREKRPATPAEVMAALDAILAELDRRSPGAVDARRGGRLVSAGVAAAILASGIVAWMIARGGGPKAATTGAREAPASPGAALDAPALPTARLFPRRAEPAAPAAGATAPRADDAVRAAEAGVKLRLLRDALGEKPDPRDAAARYRALAAEYSGTLAAREAEGEARAIETRLAEALERKLSELAPIAKDFERQGEFARAAALYDRLLEEEKGGPGEKTVRAAVLAVEKSCEAAIPALAGDVNALIEKAAFAEARKRAEAFAGRAAGKAAKEAAAAVLASLERSESFFESAKKVRESLGAARAKLCAGRWDEALAALAASEKKPADSVAAREIGALRRAAEAAKKAEETIEKRLAALAGQDVELPHATGALVSGKVQGYDPRAQALAVREPASKEPTRFFLREIGPEFFERLLGDGAGSSRSFDDRLGAGLFFLQAGAVDAAAIELRAAEKLGELDPGIAADLDAARERPRERLAEAFLFRAQGVLDCGRHEAALALAERLRQDLADTAFARAHREDLRAVWTRARAAALAEAPLQQIFFGKVSGKRGGRVSIAYTFEEPAEAADWRADKKVEGFEHSQLTPLNGACELTGRARWRGAVKGDVKIEAVVRTAPQLGKLLPSAASATFVLYEREAPWTGWLCGIGFHPRELDQVTLARGGSQRAGAIFDLPSHVVGRLDGSLARAEWLWASRGPVVPSNEPLRIEIATKGKRLAMGFLKQQVVVPIPADDMRGGVTIVSFRKKVVIEELRIQGELDEQWLAKDALERAEAEWEKTAAAAEK
jgi:serine/threonine-protein kinase